MRGTPQADRIFHGSKVPKYINMHMYEARTHHSYKLKKKAGLIIFTQKSPNTLRKVHECMEKSRNHFSMLR